MEYSLKKKNIAYGILFNFNDPFSDLSNRGSYSISSNMILSVLTTIKNNYDIKQTSIKGGMMIDYFLVESAFNFFGKKVLEHNKNNNTLSIIIETLLKPSLIFDGKNLFLYNGDKNLEMTIPALSGIRRASGGYAFDPLPNGVYKVNRPYHRKDVSGMIRDGYGFSMDIIPKFNKVNGIAMNRTELRIHPDGNNPGSAGCIALSANKETLNNFYLKMSVYIKSFKEVDLTVYDSNNPNVLFNKNLGKKKINE